MGLPDMLKTLGTVIATLVTVPLVAGAVDDQVVPSDVNTLPEVLGATNVGADAPLPRMTLLAVRVVKLVPPLATESVPVTPVVSGKPVALVKTRADGVPRSGVTKVGEVLNTKLVEVVPVAPAAV